LKSHQQRSTGKIFKFISKAIGKS